MTRIGLIRHGLTDWNKERKAQGQTDIPLNETGKEQAQLLAKRFVEGEWDLVVSSHLTRAYDTADAVAKKLNLPIITDERLQERSFGKMEGTTEAERIRLWGESWRDLDLGVETDEVVQQRSIECVEEFCNLHHVERILFVSHGATLNQLIKGLLRDPSFDQGFGNTAVSLFDKNEDYWNCTVLNCTKHLEDQIQTN
ncbi:histidine phosphatase family protein [Salinibacillus xinjiangensis]|uniref:Histidine phosphatase family protein n=1 Tax=Salinibacillus xinjiangensis TaxID=1229268 RepID=A0A6G1X3X6_9BACI|nr:histidine phosphatase family protein [Salinibacillus xinjiangensis]MRG85693.1 histidine phosphatase family protein [Salinibacillus xinjiangensis]